jgi:hypothetical protein
MNRGDEPAASITIREEIAIGQLRAHTESYGLSMRFGDRIDEESAAANMTPRQFMAVLAVMDADALLAELARTEPHNVE